MGNVLHLESGMSIKNTLFPFLSTHLPITGWALVKIEPSIKTEGDLLVISTLAGQILGENFGYHNLENTDSNDILALHTEGISNEGGIIPYFALGCIQPSSSGGETRLFDGRIAAAMIDTIPELTDVVVEYSALANPQTKVRYPIVVSENGRVVRYRSKVETNLVINSGNLSENEMYHLVDTIVHNSLILNHQWSAGDLLFVNNLVTLHERLPFVGNRRMLRVRYNDKLNSRIRY